MYLRTLQNLLTITTIFFWIGLASCTSTKEVIYFNDLTDKVSDSLKTAKAIFENTIQKNDQLWISVGGSNVDDLSSLNSGNGMNIGGGAGTAAASNSGPVLGYLVEADGNIQVPYVGKIRAEGLTRTQLETKLTELFKDYTKNPIVNVRFLNYTFSVLGEVNRSGRFTMANERTTVLEALTMAGDITLLGRRDNITIVREENGERKFGKLNLLSKEIFNSPFFYLRTNDIIYVEPVKSKFLARKGMPQYLSIAAVALSLILTIVNFTKK